MAELVQNIAASLNTVLMLMQNNKMTVVLWQYIES